MAAPATVPPAAYRRGDPAVDILRAAPLRFARLLRRGKGDPWWRGRSKFTRKRWARGVTRAWNYVAF